MSFNTRVYEIVSQIPAGKVASYGQVAMLAGNWRASRAVGYALHRNPSPGLIPCHRVVFQDGKLTDGFAFGGKDQQRILLEIDGIEFSDNDIVDMKKYRWDANCPNELAKTVTNN